MVASIAYLLANCALLASGSGIQPTASAGRDGANPDTVRRDTAASKPTLTLNDCAFDMILKGHGAGGSSISVLQEFDSMTAAYKGWTRRTAMRTVIALRTSVIAASALRLGKDDSVRIESIVKEFKEKCWEQVTAKNAKQFESVCIIACGSIRNAISGWVNSLYFACKQDAHAKSFSRQAWTNNTTLVDNDCDGSWSFEFKEDTDDYLHSLYQNLEEFLESYELISKNGRKLSAADVSMVKARLQNWIAIHSRFTSFFHIAAMNMCTVEAQKAVIEEACVAMIKPGLWQHKDGELVNVDTRESLKDMVFGLFSRSSLDLTQKVNDTREYIKSHKDNEALPK